MPFTTLYKKKCIICGHSFLTQSANAKTCCVECRKQKDKIRKHNWYVENREDVLGQQKEYRRKKKGLND